MPFKMRQNTDIVLMALEGKQGTNLGLESLMPQLEQHGKCGQEESRVWLRQIKLKVVEVQNHDPKTVTKTKDGLF